MVKQTKLSWDPTKRRPANQEASKKDRRAPCLVSQSPVARLVLNAPASPYRQNLACLRVRQTNRNSNERASHSVAYSQQLESSIRNQRSEVDRDYSMVSIVHFASSPAIRPTELRATYSLSMKSKTPLRSMLSSHASGISNWTCGFVAGFSPCS